MGRGHPGSLALHPSLIPIEEMLALTWAGEDISWWQTSKQGLRQGGPPRYTVFSKLGGPLSTGALQPSPPPAPVPAGVPKVGSPSPALVFSADRGGEGISPAWPG